MALFRFVFSESCSSCSSCQFLRKRVLRKLPQHQRRYSAFKLALAKYQGHSAARRNQIRNCPQMTQIHADKKRIRVLPFPSAYICPVICGQKSFLLFSVISFRPPATILAAGFPQHLPFRRQRLIAQMLPAPQPVRQLVVGERFNVSAGPNVWFCSIYFAAVPLRCHWPPFLWPCQQWRELRP